MGLPRFILVATVSLTLVTVLVGRYNNLSRTDWPGWLQAVGSVWAVLVAVWVSWNQSESQRTRDELAAKAEIAGVIRCLRAEVETTLMYANSHIASDLNISRSGTPFRVMFPIPDNPFPIFDALIPKLGIISNDEMQREIIHTYAVAKSLAATIRHHNLMLNELSAAEVRQNEQPFAITDIAVRKHFLELAAYSDALRSEFNPAMENMRALLQILRDAAPAN